MERAVWPEEIGLQQNTSYPPDTGGAPFCSILLRYSLASMLACIARQSCYSLVVSQGQVRRWLSVAGKPGNGC